jgi:hypothetical protein
MWPWLRIPQPRLGSGVLRNGLQFDVRVPEPASFGAEMHYRRHGYSSS